MTRFGPWRDKDDVLRAFARFEQAGGNMALNKDTFAAVLGMDPEECGELFDEVFDTDSNGLVDAYEIIAGISLASQMSTADRVDFVHSLYDFNGSGDLTKDEMTIMLRTAVSTSAKMDKKIEEPPIEALEAMAEKAFQLADKDSSGTITRPEFDAYCYSQPKTQNFLQYWDGCLAQAKIADGEMFEDPDFVPGGAILYKDEFHVPPGGMPPGNVEWLRPSEIESMEDPKLWVGGTSAGDVVQGALGDCWFLSALAVMAARPHLLEQLFVPTGQEAQGRYCVKFFKDGDWINVYIDDRIPCNLAGKPLYCHSADPNEFWPCLVEKAYAKLHGTYEGLIGGYADYALADMTGGVPSVVRLDAKDVRAKAAAGELWTDMKDWNENGLLGAAVSIRTKGSHGVESNFKSGVLAGHAYSVLEMVEAGGEKLIHVRNPWGMREWTGDWKDGDVLWDENPELAEACKYTGPVNDGCFWISYEDFHSTFNTLYVVRILSREDGWLIERRESEWTEANSGGCVNNRKWTINDQMLISLEEDSELVLSVMQPDARYHVHRGPRWNKYDNPIGMVLLEHDWGSEDRVVKARTVTRDNMKGFTAPFKPLRNMTLTIDAKAGKYALIPCTFKPGGVGRYYVSAYATSKMKLLGGTEVQFDEAVSEEAGEAAELEIADPPAQEDEEADEEPQDAEDRAMQHLHETVHELHAMIVTLQKRKTALQERVASLESA